MHQYSGCFWQFIFWFMLVISIYCYVGYPIILVVIRLIYRKKIDKSEIYPCVSVVVAAFNEEKAIKRKLEVLLAQDYPADKIKIYIGSDGSTDNTEKIVNEFVRQNKGRVVLVRNETNQGKNTLYNKIYPMTDGEILFMSDATSVWPSDLVRQVVRNFNDSEVGVVGIKLHYTEPNGSNHEKYEQSMVEGQQKYWEYETFIRRMESDISTLIGVSGATFALRKELFKPVDSSLQEDFVTPLNAIEQGFRAVLEDRVCVYEETSSSKKDEFGMRVRVATRAFFSIWDKRNLLNPFTYPVICWQLTSHKILRLLMPYFLISAYILNYMLLQTSPFYALLFIGQTFFYMIGIMGPVLEKKNYRKLLLPYYFMLGNGAYFIAFIKFIRGKRYRKWKTLR